VEDKKFSEYLKLFDDADEKKKSFLLGLIRESFDCEAEIIELKKEIANLRASGAKFPIIARREKLLIQKRASYTNMKTKLCRELFVVDTSGLDDEGLEDYE